MTKLIIDVNEQFQHLPNAPIVEAVIDIRVSPGTALQEATLKFALEAKLNDYQYLDSMQQFKIRGEMNLESDTPAEPIIKELTWKGLRFQSADKKYIAQFNRDGYVFSRLESYQSWNQLYDEAMRLWNMYTEIAQPTEIQRIGLRYINRIQLPLNELRFEDYFESPAQPPKNLDVPFHSFLHQETLAVPDYPYAVNIVKTIQPPQAPAVQGLNLILDIDAFSTQGFEADEAGLRRHLLEMRWLKNKVFFGSVTQLTLKLFQ